MVSEPAAQVWGCLVKMSLLSLGLHRGFTIYLDPKVPTRALLSPDGCQVVAGWWDEGD